MSSRNSPISTTSLEWGILPFIDEPAPQSSGLVNLPEDVFFKILKMLSIQEFGCLNQTCRQICLNTRNQPPIVLLNHYFPNFHKTDPNQTDLEALKEQYFISSNLKKGVYASHALPKLNGPVRSLVLDGRRLYSGSDKGTIEIWDLDTTKCIVTLQGHKGSVWSLALDGQRLLSGSLDRSIKIWDLNTNTCTATLQGHSRSVSSLALDGQRLFSGSLDRSIKIWDLNTNACTATLQEHSRSVSCLALDRQRLFTGSLDRTIKIWDLNSNTCTATLEGHHRSVSCLVLDGQRLFSGSFDGTIKIWDLSTNTCVATLQGHNSSVHSLVLDGQRLFSGSLDRTIEIWDLNTNTCTAILQGHHDPVWSLALDGQRLFSSSDKENIEIWDFNVSDEAVFNEIADLLKNEDPIIAEDAMARFNNMPPRAKNAIYGELYHIMAPFENDYFGCAEHAFHNLHGQSSTPEQRAQAVLNYLTKRS